MRDPRPSKDSLGRQLAVVYPHPASIAIGCIPGLVMLLVAACSGDQPTFSLLLHPEVELPRGMRLFLALWLGASLLLLWMGLRHIFDRAELYRDGFCFRGKVYRFDEIGPISWGRFSNSGMTRFRDCTTMDFTCRGKSVRLKTYYLQDLRYQFRRTYGLHPAAEGDGAMSRPDSSDSYTRRPRH